MNNKKIITALLVGIIALTSLSLSFSLAWYNATNFLQVSPFKVEIVGERDLKISTSPDIDSFKESLSYSELEQVSTFAPVSSVYLSSWIDQKPSKPVFYDNSYSYTDEDGTPIRRISPYGYYSQELYLLCDDDVYVTVDALESYINANDSFNLAYASEIANDYPQYTIEEIVERLGELRKAMRFSILVPDENDYRYYILDPHKEGDVILGGVLDNSLDALAPYYDFYRASGTNELYEIVYGEYNDKDYIVYDEALESDTPLEGEANVFNACHMEGVHPFNLEKSIEQGLEFSKEQSIGFDELEQNPMRMYFPVYRHTPRKIVLSIYIEGWDTDCVNANMGASFLSNLSFKIAREM